MTFSEEEVERYARHLVLREIGGQGQQRLKSARVLLIGAGGLGAPAALYLAAAGVGVLGLVDPDQVALSNLQRQVLFSTEDVGASKVGTAKRRLEALNPNIRVEPYALAMTDANARALVAAYDIVLDGTDNFDTRFAVNAACLSEGKPLVSGALGRWTGQVGVFCLGDGPCYRCLVPEVPPDAELCSTVGVVGALAGVIGAMMAIEAVKLIISAPGALTGRILIYDALSAEARTVRLSKDPSCPACRGIHDRI
jgi:molybdopterin/thiamine biosynthesis adenylyltransferase